MIKSIAALCGILTLAACSSTNVSQVVDDTVYTGRGGEMKNINGIEVWAPGASPLRPYKVIGSVTDSRREEMYGVPNPFGSSVDRAVAEAITLGGSGVICTDTDSSVSSDMWVGSNRSTTNSGTISYNNTHRKWIIVKYLRHDEIGVTKPVDRAPAYTLDRSTVTAQKD
ncbi:MAG: hypothetical protein LBD30_02435 [Verrucomicrobiales bacterium]|nr:hypothetical protein [Verrucomicrobiales bacterium]